MAPMDRGIIYLALSNMKQLLEQKTARR